VLLLETVLLHAEDQIMQRTAEVARLDDQRLDRCGRIGLVLGVDGHLLGLQTWSVSHFEGLR